MNSYPEGSAVTAGPAFKRGDMVRALRGDPGYYPAGAVGIVTTIDGQGDLWVLWSGPDIDPDQWACRPCLGWCIDPKWAEPVGPEHTVECVVELGPLAVCDKPVGCDQEEAFNDVVDRRLRRLEEFTHILRLRLGL